MLSFRKRSDSAATWQPQLHSEQANSAIKVAREVAIRLAERERVEAAVREAERHTEFPKSIHWQASSIAQGYAGLALMHGYFHACFPGDDWMKEAHHALRLATWSANEHEYLPVGLFSGIAGLAFVANALHWLVPQYEALISAFEDVLLELTEATVRQMTAQPSKEIGVGTFDLISGLSGVGAYLLCRTREPRQAAAFELLLSGLIALTTEVDGLPRWHTPARLIVDDVMRRHYPSGHLNCGLAHGAPGILGLLALAALAGHSTPGLHESIRRLARFLADNRCDDTAGVNWPNAVPLVVVKEPDGTRSVRPGPAISAPFGPSRSAWCYGPPGIARALWFAGQALKDDQYRDLAVAAMESVFRRPISQRQIDSPTFCHGVAGLLQITLRFAHDTGIKSFTEAVRELSEQLLSCYAPETPLGFHNLEPGGRKIDQPGLLDGASGVALVLLAAATEVEPAWDRLFLLS
jgi:hypothetical protein